MPRGLFRRGYIAFLYRFLQGFVEADPTRIRKRKRRKLPRKRKKFLPSVGATARTRVRFTPLKTKLKPGGLWQLVGNRWIQVTDPTITVTGPYSTIEHTQDYKNPGPPYLTGGTFTSVKVKWAPFQVVGHGVFQTPFTFNLNNGNGPCLTQYRGGFHSPDFSGVDFSDSQYADKNFLLGSLSGFVPSMSAYHPLVDAKLRPKINVADVGQSLAEIREIPRMMRSTAKDFHDYWKFLGGSGASKRLAPKGLADSFLNSQFGWGPFVRDIQDVCDLVVNYDEHLGRRTSKNGHWDHRERVLEEKTIETPITQGEGMKCQPTSTGWLDQMLDGSAGWTKRFSYRKTEYFRVWACGDYKFYRPEFDMSQPDYDSGLNQIRRVSTLLGTNISPSLLYKITPWSWLVDWMSNVGNIIDAVSAAALDGVVSKNVFLMMKYRRDIVLTQELNMIGKPISFEFRRIVESKQRGHALTPYQFSLLPGQLSAKQWSILGALGISKFL